MSSRANCDLTSKTAYPLQLHTTLTNVRQHKHKESRPQSIQPAPVSLVISHPALPPSTVSLLPPSPCFITRALRSAFPPSQSSHQSWFDIAIHTCRGRSTVWSLFRRVPCLSAAHQPRNLRLQSFARIRLQCCRREGYLGEERQARLGRKLDAHAVCLWSTFARFRFRPGMLSHKLRQLHPETQPRIYPAKTIHISRQ